MSSIHMKPVYCTLCIKKCSPKPTDKAFDLDLFSLLRGVKNDDDGLRDGVQVIFLIRKILEMPQEICCTFLADYGDPSSWIDFCDTCSVLVQMGRLIFDQITILQKQFKTLQDKVRKTVTQIVPIIPLHKNLIGEMKMGVRESMVSFINQVNTLPEGHRPLPNRSANRNINKHSHCTIKNKMDPEDSGSLYDTVDYCAEEDASVSLELAESVNVLPEDDFSLSNRIATKWSSSGNVACDINVHSQLIIKNEVDWDHSVGDAFNGLLDDYNSTKDDPLRLDESVQRPMEECPREPKLKQPSIGGSEASILGGFVVTDDKNTAAMINGDVLVSPPSPLSEAPGLRPTPRRKFFRTSCPNTATSPPNSSAKPTSCARNTSSSTSPRKTSFGVKKVSRRPEPKPCKGCGTVFSDVRARAACHERDRGRRGEFKCPQCGRQFALRNVLKRHIKNQHQGFPIPRKR